MKRSLGLALSGVLLFCGCPAEPPPPPPPPPATPTPEPEPPPDELLEEAAEVDVAQDPPPPVEPVEAPETPAPEPSASPEPAPALGLLAEMGDGVLIDDVDATVGEPSRGPEPEPTQADAPPPPRATPRPATPNPEQQRAEAAHRVAVQALQVLAQAQQRFASSRANRRKRFASDLRVLASNRLIPAGFAEGDAGDYTVVLQAVDGADPTQHRWMAIARPKPRLKTGRRYFTINQEGKVYSSTVRLELNPSCSIPRVARLWRRE